MNVENEPERERLAKRRAYDRARHKKMKGRGTGMPSTLPALDAIRASICPLCSAPCDALHLHISVHFPGLSRKDARLAFLQKLNLPDSTSLMTDALRKSCGEGQLRRYAGPDGKRIRENLAEHARGNPSHYRADVPYWPLMRLIARGKTAEQTWKTLRLGTKITPHGIGDRARDHGFTFRAEGLCDQCEPYTYGRLYHLRRISGFEVSEFDKCVGLEEGRSDGTAPTDRIVNPGEARKAVAWRDGVLTALFKVPLLTVAGKEYRKDGVLLTFLPELVETNRSLVAAIGEIRQAARDYEWAIDELCEEICRAAAREQSIEGNPDHSRRKTLRYLCEEKSELWLTDNMARLLGGEDDGPLARKILGDRYGAAATEQTVQNALRNRAEAIAPAAVWSLIKKYAPASAESKDYGGRPLGSTKEAEKTEWYEIGRMVEERIPSLRNIFDDKGKLTRKDRRVWQVCVDALVKLGHSLEEASVVAGCDNSKEAARQLVTDARRLDYDTVAKYHKQYLQHVRGFLG